MSKAFKNHAGFGGIVITIAVVIIVVVASLAIFLIRQPSGNQGQFP